VSEFIEDRSVLSRPAPPPDSTVRYDALGESIADIRYGKGAPAERPLIIFIHGGFWRPQFNRMHAAPLCVGIAEAGWTIASLEYRRVPGSPDATLHDVGLAIEKLPALIGAHNGKAIVAGHSAGGHLALWAAGVRKSEALIGALGLGPVADLQAAASQELGDRAVQAFLGDSVNRHRDFDPCQLPSPRHAVSIVHGIQDAIVPVALSENYLACHEKTRLIRVNDCGHFAVIDPTSTAWPIVCKELDWLSQS